RRADRLGTAHEPAPASTWGFERSDHADVRRGVPAGMGRHSRSLPLAISPAGDLIRPEDRLRPRTVHTADIVSGKVGQATWLAQNAICSPMWRTHSCVPRRD